MVAIAVKFAARVTEEEGMLKMHGFWLVQLAYPVQPLKMYPLLAFADSAAEVPVANNIEHVPGQLMLPNALVTVPFAGLCIDSVFSATPIYVSAPLPLQAQKAGKSVIPFLLKLTVSTKYAPLKLLS